MKIQRKEFNLWILLFLFCKEEIKIQRKGSLDITTIVFISQELKINEKDKKI